ncbi:MAG TPA: hypothetical protein VNL73_11235 [Verrucomicrobiae bacterium]|nr:hypothetical protein [Verrucomicrobiae bacterium]
MDWAETLRSQISILAGQYAEKYDISHLVTPSGVVIFKEDLDNGLNGNFIEASYKTILNDENWKKRLQKPHPHFESDSNIRELDSCTSSDALLMNIFCFPDVIEERLLGKLLGITGFQQPEFGYEPGVMKNGSRDKTEIDMKIGKVIFESKLTENNFTDKEKHVVERYDNFHKVFNSADLFQDESNYKNYQLIRNVLAAFENGFSFYLLCDARRPDLVREFYFTVRCVRDQNLRSRCCIIFWQEIADSVNLNLRFFLKEKYGL